MARAKIKFKVVDFEKLETFAPHAVTMQKKPVYIHVANMIRAGVPLEDMGIELVQPVADKGSKEIPDGGNA
jgi:hypothetical protein